MNIDKNFLISALPFWKDLSLSQQNEILNSVGVKTYPKNTIMIHGGSECSGFLLVKSGQLRAYSLSSEGKQITLYRLLDRDSCIMTASCLLKNINFEVSIDVEKETEVYIIPADVFDRLGKANLAASAFILDLVTSRFTDVMWIFEQYVFSNMASRLANALLEQASLKQSDELDITHEVLARELGTAREVVTRLLKQFQIDGLVSLSRGNIKLDKEEELYALSQK